MKNFKLFSFILLFFVLFLGQGMVLDSNNAFGKEYITYDTFVHLDDESQRKVVLMVMDYMIVAESMYPHKEAYISPQKKKTVEAMKTLWNQIIFSSAYAEGTLDTSKLCLYGGWVSLMTNDKCTHPMNIANGGIHASKVKKIGGETQIKLEKSAAQYKASSLSNKNCKATQNIVCSPEIFGTDANEVPFCVGGNKDAKNTSLACFNKVNNASDKEKILDKIVAKALANPEAFSETLKMMYGTCMCQDDSYINQSYAERIYNHRTCYGIIMQSRNILDKMFNENNRTNSCKVLHDIKYTDIARMSDFAIQAYNKIKIRFTDESFTDLTAREDDSIDENFLRERRGDLESLRQEGVCPLDFGYGVKISLSDNKDNTHTVTATLLGVNANTDENRKKLEWNLPDHITPLKEIDKLTLVLPQVKKPYKVTAHFNGKSSNEVIIPELKTELSIVSEGPQDKVEILKANLVGVEPIDKTKFVWSLVEEGKGEIKGEEDKAQATIPEQEAYKVKVSYNELSAEYEVKPIEAACTITKKVSPQDKKEETSASEDTIFLVTLGKVVSTDGKIDWSPAPSKLSENSLEATYKDYKGEAITVTIGEQSCSFSPNDATNSDELSDYTLAIKETNSNSTQSDFEATIKKGDKDQKSIPEGYSIIWYTYDATFQKKAEEKEKETSTDNYDEFDSTPSENSSTTKVGTGKTTIVTKSDKKQMVYAELVKGEKKINSNELAVEKITTKPVQQNLNNNPVRPNTLNPNIFRKGLGGQRGVF